MLTARTIGLASVGLGVCLELAVHLATGRREAWDSGLYWTVGLPAAAAAALGLGYLARGSDWKWTLLVVPGQVLAMMVRNMEFGSLWPLTLALSAVLSAPFLIAAFIGSRFRRWSLSKVF